MKTRIRNPFESAVRLVKTAGMFDGLLSSEGMDPSEGYLASVGRADIGRAALTALGLGAAARGGVGLLNLARRRLSPPQPRFPGVIEAPVPYPVTLPPGGDLDGEDEKQSADGNMLGGVTRRDGFAWYVPAMMASAGVGGLAGWKGVDYLLNRQRESEQADELSSAKSEFEQALLDSYPKPRVAAPGGLKTAAVDSPGQRLGAVLDGLFAGLTKSATLQDWLGRMSGAYLGAYALPMALGAGALAYSHGRAASQDEILQQALKRRMQHAYAVRPPEVFAMPQPVPVATPEDDEEADGAR